MLSMKRLLIPLALVIMLVLSTILLAFMPYHFYYVALDSGLDSRFLKTGKVPENFLKGAPLEFEKSKFVATDSEKRWRDFHVGNYILPMPVRHPYFLLIP